MCLRRVLLLLMVTMFISCANSERLGVEGVNPTNVGANNGKETTGEFATEVGTVNYWEAILSCLRTSREEGAEYFSSCQDSFVPMPNDNPSWQLFLSSSYHSDRVYIESRGSDVNNYTIYIFLNSYDSHRISRSVAPTLNRSFRLNTSTCRTEEENSFCHAWIMRDDLSIILRELKENDALRVQLHIPLAFEYYITFVQH